MRAPLPPSLRQRAQAFWSQRAPRERLALRLLAGILLVALLAQTLWSLAQYRQRQLRQLPILAASAERMTQLAEAWRLLAPPGDLETPSMATLQPAIEARLGELGPGIQARWQGRRLALAGQADFSRWIAWTAAVQREHRLIPEKCTLRDVDGRLQIDAVYRPAGGES